MENNQEVLPFDKRRAEALLGHIITNYSFFLKCNKKFKEQWFYDPKLREIYSKYREFYRLYNKCPASIEEFKTQFSIYDAGERRIYYTAIDQCIMLKDNYNLDVMTKNITGWMKSIVWKNNIQSAVDHFKGQRPELAFEWSAKAQKELIECTIEDDIGVDFSSPADLVRESTRAFIDALTTGLPSWDSALGGGLCRGDMSVFLAPVNIGKTTTLITIVVANLLKGRKVLLMTHEGRANDINMKIFCCLLKKTPKEILEMTLNAPEELSRISEQYLVPNLRYIPYNKADGMFVEDVVDIIKFEQQKLLDSNGKGFDLLVNDYPAKLTTRHGKNLDKRHIDGMVYDRFVQLALEYDFHVVAAVQTNRDGSRRNRDGGGTSWLTMEDVAESFVIPQIAANVFTINRSEDDNRNNMIYYHIDKSRSSETGMIVAAQSDFAKGSTHDSDRLHGVVGGYNDRNNILRELQGRNKLAEIMENATNNIDNTIQ